jgi:Zn-dependent protease with chaperone function
VVGALLRAWKVEDGRLRVAFRLLALAAPLAWLPALWLAVGFRSSPEFAGRWALFAGERWNLLHAGDTGVGDLLLVLAAGLGSWLFLRDAVPSLVELLRAPRETGGGPWQGAAATIGSIASRHAARLGIAVPPIRIVHTSSLVLLCEGGRRPTLVASRGTVEQFTAGELDAAIAHELAHVRYRDPAWGYVLIAVRGLLFFNPAAQWVARSVVDDIERRADQAAAALTGDAEAMSRVIRRIFEKGHPPPGDAVASFERVFWRVRREGVERRCERLKAPVAVPTPGEARLQFALATVAVLGLTFFVV